MPKNEAPVANSPDIAKVISDSKSKILDEWANRMRSDVPPARHTKKQFLVNSLPLFIDKLIESLEVQKTIIKEAKETAAEHAEQRADLEGFELPDVMKEYKILRQVIFDTIELVTEVPVRARNIILDYIQTGTIEVAAEFCRLNDDKVKRAHTSESESRDQFVAALSHDLKTPLASARLAAEILERQIRKKEHRQAIATTLRNIDRVDKMVENFLDVNLIVAGQTVPLNIEKCNLTKILKDVVRDMQSIYGKRFVLKCPEQDVVGSWSAPQLIRCIENICGNAVKYGEAKKPITVSLEKIKKSVQISIHNFGTPIPKKQLESLFQPYQRAESASKSGKKGWGLGLTLVKGVVEAHGGKVKIKSNKQGTTVIIEFL